MIAKYYIYNKWDKEERKVDREEFLRNINPRRCKSREDRWNKNFYDDKWNYIGRIEIK